MKKKQDSRTKTAGQATCGNCIYSDRKREKQEKIKCWMKHEWVDEAGKCPGHRRRPEDRFYQEGQE